MATGSQTGSVTRLITDPQQRVFRRTQRAPGAIVLVDQSGSMDVADHEIDGLIRALPGVTIVGYSHRPGDVGETPNAWVVAQQGRRASVLPTGNVGNGVDGPILRWASSRRRTNERIVWVTDGQVTDSNDHPHEALSRECAGLVTRHRIELVRTLDDARRLLERGTRSTLKPDNFGRVGRALTAKNTLNQAI
jgi:predicted metal-dependent peptidase